MATFIKAAKAGGGFDISQVGNDGTLVIQTSQPDGSLVVNALSVAASGEITFGKLRSAARRTRDTAQTIPNATSTIVAYNVLTFDNLSELAVTGRFTATVAGIYQVNAALVSDSGIAWLATQYWTISVFKNGVMYAGNFNDHAQASHTYSLKSKVSTIVSLLAGDYIDIRAIHNNGVGINTAASAASNYFDVIRVA